MGAYAVLGNNWQAKSMRNWQLPNILHIFHPCLYLKELFFLALVHKILILSHISDRVWSDIIIYLCIRICTLTTWLYSHINMEFFHINSSCCKVCRYHTMKVEKMSPYLNCHHFLRIPLTFQSSNNICNIQLFNISQLASISVPF